MKFVQFFSMAVVGLLLLGCGGGSSDVDTESNTDTPTTESAKEQPTSNSSKLADHPSRVDLDIKMFTEFIVKLNLDEVELTGDYRFVKIVDSSEQTLFLGQVALKGGLALPLNVSVNAFPLQVEIFSESSQDESMVFEVEYD